jgi:hypothetical protein
MRKLIAALLLASCGALQAWANTQEGQTTPQPLPAEQKPADGKSGGQRGSAQSTSAQTYVDQDTAASAVPASRAATGPAVEITEFPLDKFQNFSAIAHGGPIPGTEADVHFYRAGNLVRTEGRVAVASYYVTDLTTLHSTSVTPVSCLRMGAPNVRAFPFFIPAPGNKYEITPVGEDTVDGHHVHVEDLMIRRPKLLEELDYRLYEADDLEGFPIKIENVKKQAWHWTIHYRNVRLEPQDRSLFIVPEKCDSDADFKKMPPPGAKPKPKPTTPAKPQ